MSDSPTFTHNAPNSWRQRIAGAGIVLILSQVLGNALQVFVFSSIQHTLSKADNGAFFWVQQITSFPLIIFVEMGMNSVAMRMAVEQRHDGFDSALLPTFFRLRLFLWAVVTLALLTFVYFSEQELLPLVCVYSFYCGIAARGTLLRSVLELPRRSENRQLLPALAGVLDIILACVFIIIDKEHLTPFRVIVLFCLASSPGFLVLLFIDKGWKILFSRWHKSTAKKLLVDSAPIFLSICLMQIQDKSDSVALNIVYGRETLGVLSAVMRIVVPFVGLLMVISFVLSPVITELNMRDQERRKKYVVWGLELTLICSALCAFFASGFVDYIVFLTAGTKYLPYSQEFVLGVWSLVPNLCVAYILSILTALGAQRKVLPMMLTLGASAVAGNFALTPAFGISGALSARMLAWCAAGAIGLFALSVYAHRSLLLKSLGQTILCICLLALALYCMPYIVADARLSPANFTLQLAYLSGSCLICLGLSGFFSKTTLTAIRSFIQRS